MKKFIVGFVVAILVIVGVVAAVMATGVMNVAAAPGPGFLESGVLSWASDRSIDFHAGTATNPFAGSAAVREEGFDHYHESCVLCHGAPGVPRAEFARGLNPPAPDLMAAAKEMEDAQLFWIVKNGIRMTGMPAYSPTHTDEQIWKIVTFLHDLADLTPEEKSALEARTGGESGDRSDRSGSQAPGSK